MAAFENLRQTTDLLATELAALRSQIGNLSPDVVGAIAAGSTLGLQQQLLANAGQPALTVLAIGSTFTDSPGANGGKAVGTSLGAGNTVRVFENGADYRAGKYKYQEFMGLGEDIGFTDVHNGAIITSSKGFYGVSEQKNGNATGPMPLLSYGLATKDTFFRALRNCHSYTPGASSTNQGFVNLVCGPIAAKVTLRYGDGRVVQGQENIPVGPWDFLQLYTDGNVEYRLQATEFIMPCHAANMSATNPQFYDSRLIMPLSDRLLLPSRSGQLSAPFDDTIVRWFTRDGESGSLNNGLGVSPGFPVNLQAAPPVGTGANEAAYRPDAWGLFLVNGLASAYSGADGAGVDATAGMPADYMSQVLPQPFHIKDIGDGRHSGIAIASLHPGKAHVFEWDQGMRTGTLKYEVGLTRRNVTVTSREDQYHPCAGILANETVDGAVSLNGDLGAGYIVSNVPITMVAQNGDLNHRPTIRSQNGGTTTTVASNDDEVLLMGLTWDEIAAELKVGSDGLKYRREINASANPGFGEAAWVGG